MLASSLAQDSCGGVSALAGSQDSWPQDEKAAGFHQWPKTPDTGPGTLPTAAAQGTAIISGSLQTQAGDASPPGRAAMSLPQGCQDHQ